MCGCVNVCMPPDSYRDAGNKLMCGCIDRCENVRICEWENYFQLYKYRKNNP